MDETPDGDDVQLSEQWRAWVVDNALEGVERDTLVATLVSGGIPGAVAEREVRQLLTEAPLSVYARYERRIRRLKNLVDLWHHTTVSKVDETEQLPAAEVFFQRYFEPGRPLLIRQAATRWPALKRWSMDDLAQRFGDVPIEVEIGRDAAWNHEGRYVSARLGEFIDDLRANPNNDTYCIARNNNIRRAELAGLLDDIHVDPEWFDPDPQSIARGSSLWIGGRTTTPLHHDSTHILFHQIVGRKRWTLLPPSTASLVDDLDGYYYRPGLDGLPANVRRFELTLSPGQALFVPAGWYHHVEALELCVSFSLLNFRRPNDLSWFAPGKL